VTLMHTLHDLALVWRTKPPIAELEFLYPLQEAIYCPKNATLYCEGQGMYPQRTAISNFREVNLVVVL
jgi:hypothetical protein